MSQTVVEKLAQAHLAEGPNRPLRAGDFVSIRPTHVMTHDNTSAVMRKFEAIGATKLHDPRQLVFALDHDIQNHSEDNQKKYRAIEAFARVHGIEFYPAGTGIGHQIMVERGFVLPGNFVVASDSHSNMYGLHPLQIPVVHQAFAPPQAEIEKALKIVAAFDEARQRGLGVTSLGSKMIDPPVVQRALKLVERARHMGLLKTTEASKLENLNTT